MNYHPGQAEVKSASSLLKFDIAGADWKVLSCDFVCYWFDITTIKIYTPKTKKAKNC